MTYLIVCAAKWTICSQELSIKALQYMTPGHEKGKKDLETPPGSQAATVYTLCTLHCTSSFKALKYSDRYFLYQR